MAGLTAAHELVERGFLVQIVESTPDPFHPGRPLVGGLAANQPARMRANIEALHADLVKERLAKETPEGRRKIVTWLMWILALNRTRWIQTETPFELPPMIHDSPKVGEERSPTYLDVVRRLQAGKRDYQERWVCDLVGRPVHMRALSEDGHRPSDDVLEGVKLLEDRWKSASAWDIARQLRLRMEKEHEDGLNRGQSVDTWPINVPTEQELEPHLDCVAAALEREFLCFRLVPQAVLGVEGAEERARSLLTEWQPLLRAEPALANCLLANSARVAPAREPVRNAVGEFMTAWLQIEIVEKRIPGEHGYRFFPSSYRHLDDTMKRIPLFDEAGDPTGFTVFDNLRPTVVQGLGMTGADLKGYGVDPDLIDRKDDPAPARVAEDGSDRGSRVVAFHRDRARSFEGLRNRTDRFIERLGGTKWDGILFGSTMFRYLSSCPERRRAQYEDMPWSKFARLDRSENEGGFSQAMTEQMKAAAQALLAFSVGEADARTYGDTAAQLFLDQLDDGARTDRTLDGPTTSAWLEPWRRYLRRQGVRFFCARVARLTKKGTKGEIVPEFEPAEPVSDEGERLYVYDEATSDTSPDFYVLALDLPGAAKLLQEAPSRSAEWSKIVELYQEAKQSKTDKKSSLKDMTGVQFFFDAKTSIGDGHMYFPGSPWGLSAISQSEFWRSRGGFSDGYLGVLSVDICTAGDADTKGSFWQILKHGGPHAVARRTWEQIKARIGHDELPDPKCFHVDRNVLGGTNSSPYLAATPEVVDRPGRRGGSICVGKEEVAYQLSHERWVVCGAYMATHTRMTTMEAANESARHAVKTILDVLGKDDHITGRPSDAEPGAVTGGHSFRGALLEFDALGNKTYNGAWGRRRFDPPDVWDPEDHELEDMDLLRRIDRRLLQLGLPHCFEILRVDEKLHLAYQTSKIYERDLRDVNLQNLLGLGTSTVDAVRTKEEGRGYAKREAERRASFADGLSELVARMQDGKARFPDMHALGLEHLDTLLKKLTNP